MRLLPESRRGRAAVAAGLAALLLALVWCYEYRPWEARYRGRPTSWWAAWVCDPEWRKPRPLWEKLREEVRVLLGGTRPLDLPAIPDLLEIDIGSDAIPVLVELLEWPDDRARGWGALGLVGRHYWYDG